MSPTDSWIAVVPFKGSPEAKSRLEMGIARRLRGALGRAFVVDTVAAAQGTVARVIVVSNEPSFGEAFDSDHVEVVADPGGGLNAAISHGIEVARARQPGANVVALLGDLAALRTDDLARALAAAEDAARDGRPLAFVADHAGTGTTMITIAAGAHAQPHFGEGSAAAHAADGFAPLHVAAPTLRLDIDSVVDLRAALALPTGVGETTHQVLDSLATQPVASVYDYRNCPDLLSGRGYPADSG